MLAGLFGGGGSAPRYTPSPQYRALQYQTVYPHLQRIIEQGGLGLDTAGLERSFKENTAANYGGAMQRVKASTVPYGNPAAGNRAALRIATAQAGEESRGIRDIRTQSNAQKNQTYMGSLGLAGGLEDQELKAFYANLARYNAQSQRDAGMAGLLGDLAGLGFLAWNPAAGTAAGSPGAVSMVRGGAVNLPMAPW